MGDVRRFADASNRLFDILLFEAQPSVILDSLAQILGETLGVERSMIYDVSFTNDTADGLTEWLDPASPTVTPTKATYPLDVFRDSANHLFATHASLESHADARNPVLVSDRSAKLLHEDMKIESLLWVPFSFRDDGFYLLAFNAVGKRHAWSEDELAFVRSATRHVGMALLKIALLRERAAAEERLLAAQKLDSLGVLAGGIAHDFNNLMVGVIGNAQLVTRQLPADSALQPLLDAILYAGERAAKLAGQLLAYAGKSEAEVTRVDLHSVVEATVDLVRASMSDVDFALSIACDPTPIECNLAQVEQVVLNLLINAAEALVDRDQPIRVQVTEVHLDEAEASRYAPIRPAPGRYVALEIVDRGCGMPPEVQARMFEPFYTTKFTGRGLGLSAVLGIVKQHGGAVRITSLPDVGTTFVIVWPAAARAVAPAVPADPPRDVGEGHTILLVDDEPLVGNAIQAILQQRGFGCVLTDGGRAGIARFEERPDDFDLALVDLTMPGVGGRAVLRRLRELRPQLPVVLMSGYTEHDVRAELDERTAFIKKPFLSEELYAVICAVLPGR
jgi:signal transduction histidine kinase/CheY-like chemotaxis protein